jgi:hypothetical protein
MIRLVLPLVACAVLSACRDGSTYTLYRSSVTDENLRLHVATFDSSDGEAYNRGNCDQAQQLFQAQPSVKTKFWCEKDRFRR